MGFRRPDGRVGTRNFVLIVPTSMCASHEATQISMMSEFMHYSREKFPNVDGVVAIPHNKGCGCQDGSTLDVMMRTLSNYADHPNVGGVILIDLGCEKTNLSFVEKYLTKREKPIEKPVFKIGIQDVGGTQAAIEIGLKEVEKMLPEVNRCVREEFPVSELVLGVKCGSSDGFSGISANPSLGYAPTCWCAAAAPFCSPRCRNFAAPNIFWRTARKIRRPAARSMRWSIGIRITRRNSAACSVKTRAPAIRPAGC